MNRQRAFIVGFLLLALVGIPLGGGLKAQTLETVPDPVDARSAAMGGVSGGDGDFMGSLLQNPGLLGAMNRNQAAFQRGSDNDRADGFWTRDHMELRRSSTRWNMALSLSEARVHDLAALDLPRANLLDRRVAWGFGRTLTRDGRFGLGFLGTASFLDADGQDSFGYGTGLGFHCFPVRNLVVAPSVQYFAGDRYDALPDGERVTWNLLSAYEVESRGLLAVGEYQDNGLTGAGLRVGLEADLLKNLWPQKNLQPLDEFSLRLGVNRFGMTYGAGMEFLDFRFEAASGMGPDGRFGSWSIAHAWGPSQRQARSEIKSEERQRARLRREAESLLGRGEYPAAAARFNDLAVYPGLSDSEAEDCLATAAACLEYQAKLEQADQCYWTIEEFGEIGEAYGDLVKVSPRFEEAGRRQQVVAAMTMALDLIKNAHGTRESQNMSEAMVLLEGVQQIEPELPLLVEVLLKQFNRLNLSLEIDDIFPAIFRHYEKHPLGRLVVVNNYPIQIEKLYLTFQLKGLMEDLKLEPLVGLAPGDTVAIPLYARFEPAAILDSALESPRSAWVKAIVESGGTRVDRSAQQTVNIHGPDQISWEQPGSLNAFVNPNSISVKRVMQQVRDLVPQNYENDLPARSSGIFNSVLVFNLAKQFALNVEADPKGADGTYNGRGLDSVKGPDQTLKYGGDCDDMVVLWASLLMNRGVSVAAVKIPYHIMLLADTGVPVERWEDLLLPRDVLVFREDRVWLPLEATTNTGSFYGMVGLGAELMADASEKELTYIPLGEAAVDYPSAAIDRQDSQRNLDVEALKQSLAADLRSLGENRQARRQQLLEEAAGDIAPGTCREALDRAVALAVVGELDAAEILLTRMSDCGDLQPEILNNRGAIALQQGDYVGATAFFREALERKPGDSGIILNLNLARFLAGGGEGTGAETPASADSSLVGFQDLVASLGVETVTRLLGGIVPSAGERDRVSGTADLPQVYLAVDESLEADGAASEEIQRLRRRLGNSGFQPDRPPAMFLRSERIIQQETSAKADDGTRHTRVEFPERVRAGIWETLRVQVVDPHTYGDDGRILDVAALLDGELAFKPDLQLQEIYFLVRGRGCRFDGSNRGELTLPLTGSSNAVEIKVLAESDNPVNLEIDFYQNGRNLGRVTRNAVVLAEGQQDPAQPELTRTHLGRGGTPADLLVEIFPGSQPDGSTAYQFILHSPDDKLALQGEDGGTTNLVMPPEAWMAAQYKALDGIWSAPFQGDPGEHLASLGRKIFTELFPPALQDILGADSGIRTIVLRSEESVIPWELANFALAGVAPQDNRFLCERYIVTRWSGPLSMPYDLPVDQALLVAVRTSPDRRELNLGSKTRLISQGIRAGGFDVEVVDPSLREMRNLFADSRIGLFHFECHGDTAETGDLSTLYLKDGVLRAQYLGNPQYSIGTSRPMMFLDACYAGRTGKSLSGTGGWAPDAMAAGASVFVAPLWKVDERDAGVFAETLYEELAQGQTLGEAVQAARTSARESAPAGGTGYTWLAYTVYGDPNARLMVR